jgi:hypothetical protein
MTSANRFPTLRLRRSGVAKTRSGFAVPRSSERHPACRGGRFVRPAWLQAFTEPRSTIKIMSVVCHSARAGMAGHVVTREGTKPNDDRDLVTSGDTGQHEI